MHQPGSAAYIRVDRPPQGRVRVAFVRIGEDGQFDVISTDVTKREWLSMSHAAFVAQIADPAICGLRDVRYPKWLKGGA